MGTQVEAETAGGPVGHLVGKSNQMSGNPLPSLWHSVQQCPRLSCPLPAVPQGMTAVSVCFASALNPRLL